MSEVDARPFAPRSSTGPDHPRQRKLYVEAAELLAELARIAPDRPVRQRAASAYYSLTRFRAVAEDARVLCVRCRAPFVVDAVARARRIATAHLPQRYCPACYAGPQKVARDE